MAVCPGDTFMLYPKGEQLELAGNIWVKSFLLENADLLKPKLFADVYPLPGPGPTPWLKLESYPLSASQSPRGRALSWDAGNL